MRFKLYLIIYTQYIKQNIRLPFVVCVTWRFTCQQFIFTQNYIRFDCNPTDDIDKFLRTNKLLDSSKVDPSQVVGYLKLIESIKITFDIYYVQTMNSEYWIQTV